MLELLKKRRALLWETIHSYSSIQDIPNSLYESMMDEILSLDIEISLLENSSNGGES